MEQEFNLEARSREQFVELRLRAHAQSDQNLKERIETNPIPTEEETSLGLFKERIEPQVRDALFDLHRKGYHTLSSGFDYKDPSKQNICFYDEVQLSEEVKKLLESLGVKISSVPFRDRESNYWKIEFTAEKPDLESLKIMWDKISKLMPDTGHTPWISSMADKFKEEFPSH